MKYDDVNWHIEGAVQAGQPEENAFTHIGLYLAWLIRRDLVDRTQFIGEDIEGIQAREMAGSELAGLIDGKLDSDMLTPEGSAFSDWYYPKYLDDYTTVFSGETDYSVADGHEASDQIEPVLDSRFEEWIAAGQPSPEPRESIPPMPAGPVYATIPGLDLLDPELQEQFRKQLQETAVAMGWHAVEMPSPPQPHDAPQLEELIPVDMFAGRVRISSTAGAGWAAARLKRTFESWGVDIRSTAVADAMGGSGSRTMTVAVFSVPGIESSRLKMVLPKVVQQPGAKCGPRTIDGTEVLWCSRPEFLSAGWVRDGLIFYATSPNAQDLEAAIARMA